MIDRLALCLAATAFAVAITGCSGSVSTGRSVSKEEIAKQAQARFDAEAQAHGQSRFPTIVCPKDLDGKVGASEQCSARGNDGTLAITASVTSIDGDTAHLQFQGDTKLTPNP